MAFRECRGSLGPSIFIVMATLLILAALPCYAQQTVPEQKTSTPLVSNFRPSPPTAANRHPLTGVIEYAQKEQEFLRRTVGNFSCRLIKRERINGFLQEYHYIDMEVREASLAGGRSAKPFATYLHFLGPKLVVDRRIIFVEGQNEGRMLVRNGGRHFEYVIARLDPNGKSAREESLVPITDIGFTRLLGKMIEVLERHRLADPDGKNTEAVRIPGAKINERPCTLIRVTHPRQTEGLEFHVANVFVDDELHVPVRVDYSDWPKYPRGPVPLIAEYTYTELKLNIDLPEGAFSRSRLRSRRD